MSTAQVTRLLLVLWFVFAICGFVTPFLAAFGTQIVERPSGRVLLCAGSALTGAVAITSLGYIVWMWVAWGLTP